MKKEKFVIKDILTNKKKLDRRYYLVQRFKQFLAAFVLGSILGALFGCYLADGGSISIGSPEVLEQTIEVKAVEVTTPKIPCDYDAITYIRCRGQQLGYKDTDISVFVRIARAESNFNPLAKNKSSTATGIYQFINGTFHRYCTGKNVYNFVDNIDCFYKVLETDGYPKALNHWNASRSKWEK